MDILIKNMEMPKSCSECMFCALGGTGKYRVVECELLSEIDDIHDIDESYDKWYYNQVHHLCPLVELPEHGRLIDADELEALLDEVNGYGCASEITYMKMIEILNDFTLVPTVVEATE